MTTRKTSAPPPPDPLDAADHFLDLQRRKVAELRETSFDNDEPNTATNLAPINVTVNIPDRAQSAHEIDVPARQGHGGGIAAAVGAIAAAGVALARALGWL